MATLQQIGDHLDMSAQAVQEFCRSKGIEWQSHTVDHVRIVYIRHIREIAAGRSDAALAQERARLAREQADKVAMQNARMRRELAPVGLLEASLASMSRQIAAVLEAIPVLVKRRLPDIKQEALDAIAEEVVKARNMAAAARLDIAQDDDGSLRDRESDTERAETA